MEPERVSHYRIERLIARGGMGEVYEGLDLNLSRRVALKFVAPELTADAESLKRFEREALAAAALNHPNIATLFAFEREGERPFIAMELLSGESLRSHLAAGPLPVQQVTAIGRDVADALAYAHRRGVIHRDIKPENLMFDEHRRIKITDFGLARVAHTSTVTVAGSILGTAAYMAPECAHGEAAAPADVFALGVLLYEALAGRTPFIGDGPLATLFAIANQEPAPLRSVRTDVDEPLETLVARMLAKPPSQRPTAAEVAAALGGRPAPVSTEAVTVALEASGAAAAVSPTGPSASGSPGTGAGPKRKRARWVGSLVILGLAIAAGLTIALLVWPVVRAARAREALAINNRGVEALQRDDLDEARARFEQALKLDPRLGSAMINLGMLHIRQGHVPQAESLFTVALRRRPSDRAIVAQARYNLGTIDLDTGAFESAVGNLGASFAGDSTTARIYNNYGLALIRVGRAPEGLALLERGIARFPTAAPLHKNAGLALLELGRAAEALPHLDRALALDSTLVEARSLRDQASRAARR